MLDKLVSVIRKWAASSERDRMDGKFEKIDSKVDHLDERIDSLERSQAAQNEKLSAIYSVSLANNEALEQKLNMANVSAQTVREIVDVRVNSFQESLKRLELLFTEIVNSKR